MRCGAVRSALGMLNFETHMIRSHEIGDKENQSIIEALLYLAESRRVILKEFFFLYIWYVTTRNSPVTDNFGQMFDLQYIFLAHILSVNFDWIENPHKDDFDFLLFINIITFVNQNNWFLQNAWFKSKYHIFVTLGVNIDII